jgi:CubicO group peptidase (beta-lactamase class C family)
MTTMPRAWLAQGAFILCGVTAAFASPSALAATTLQVLDGSGDFSHLSTWTSVEQPKALQMYWSTDQQNATGGTWQVTTSPCVRCAPVVVASGESPRGNGPATWFTIPADAFLKSPGTQTQLTFNVMISAHNAAFQALGSTSVPVVVYQYPPSGGVVFGDVGNYPKVEIVSYAEKLDNVPPTVDFTVRVSNKSNTATVPAVLSVKDEHVLMKQSSLLSVPAMAAGASQVYSVHMDAMMPIDQQPATWKQQYKDNCGLQLASLLDYAGPPAQSPTTSHVQAPLVKEGFLDYANAGLASTICDGKSCINVCKLEKEIRSRLDGHVVGYSFFAGQYPHFASGGKARTAADGGNVDFSSTTKFSAGSVSKFISAVGTIAVLDKYGVSVDAAIGPYLPADWSASSYIKNLTFAQLLSQTTGIKTYGNVAQTYAQLKTFYTQSISNAASTACPNNTTTINVNPINPNNMGYCYSNYNFAILRILLPKVAGYSEDANQATRPQTLANQFQVLVQQNVFDKVGQAGVACKPPSSIPGATTYSWAHVYPGSQLGTDFGDESLVCGAASWNVSTEDMAKVVMSLNKGDGKILKTSPDRYAEMRTRRFGLDVAGNGEIEKNGAWGSGNGNLHTASMAVFGPVAGNGPRVLATLLLNSDISGGPNAGNNAQAVLEQAYAATRYTLP